jgi:hypothetical protein
MGHDQEDKKCNKTLTIVPSCPVFVDDLIACYSCKKHIEMIQNDNISCGKEEHDVMDLK